MHDYGWSHMGGMWFFWILLLALIGLGIWWAVTSTGRKPPAVPETPEETLKRRYAEGEVDREEYEKRLKNLRS